LEKVVQKADRNLRLTPARYKETSKEKTRVDKRILSMGKKLETLNKERSQLLAQRDGKIERGELDRDGEDETTDAIRNNREKVRALEAKLKDAKQNELNLQARMEKQLQIMSDATDILNTNLIGTEPVQLYSSAKAVADKAAEFKKKEKEVRQAMVSLFTWFFSKSFNLWQMRSMINYYYLSILLQNAYDDAEAVLETEFNVPPRSSFIDNPFQVKIKNRLVKPKE